MGLSLDFFGQIENLGKKWKGSEGFARATNENAARKLVLSRFVTTHLRGS
jgi:hypothetical protein